MPNILVAVTAYRSSIKAQCAMSLLKLQRQFHLDGTESEFRYADMTLIRRARNYFATLAAQEARFTHLLFVDDDMEFEPLAVIKMLRAGTPIIGAACSGRTLDVDRVIALGREKGLTTPQATAFAASFNLFMTAKRKANPGGLRVIAGERIEVDGVGMGLALIETSCLREMIARGLEIDDKTFNDRRHDLNGPMYGFFSSFPSEADPDAEDYAFCQRWISHGGSVQALVSETIGHVGEMVYRANFLERLKLIDGR